MLLLGGLYSRICFVDIELKASIFSLKKLLLLFLVSTSRSFSLAMSKSHFFDLHCYIFTFFTASLPYNSNLLVTAKDLLI